MNALKANTKLVIRVIAFLCILFLLLIICSSVFKEKWYKYDSIYQIKKESVDYLTAGMSQDYYGVYPVYIYDHTGYVGFNLGDEAQDIRFSWFWLVEALKTQTPKVFFLDVGNLFYTGEYMAEGWKLKEYSAMRFSREKIRATLEGTDDRDTQIGSLFPLGYFHESWKKLGEADYVKTVPPSLGANIRYDVSGSSSPVTVNPYRERHEGMQEYKIRETISRTNQEYFERIVNLCLEKGVRLIPIKVPTKNWDEDRHKEILAFLERYGLPFFDLSQEKGLINWETDTFDTGYHLNYWGGCKVSERLGEYLNELLSERTVESEKSDDPVLNDIAERSHHETVSQLLPGILTGPEKREQFFRWLEENKGEYTVVFSMRDHLTGDVEEINQYFKLLGLSDYTDENRCDSYVAIVQEGEVAYEKWDKTNKIVFHGVLSDDHGTSDMEIRSYGKASHLITDSANLASVKVAGTECALNTQGLNICVFDASSGKLLSSNVIFNDSEYIVQGAGGENYLSRLLADHSGVYCIREKNYGQNVTLQYYETGTYFVLDQEGNCLTVEHSRTEAGTKAVWTSKTESADQLWMLFPDENGNYCLRSLYNRLWLEVGQDGTLALGDSEEQKVIIGAVGI